MIYFRREGEELRKFINIHRGSGRFGFILFFATYKNRICIEAFYRFRMKSIPIMDRFVFRSYSWDLDYDMKCYAQTKDMLGEE